MLHHVTNTSVALKVLENHTKSETYTYLSELTMKQTCMRGVGWLCGVPA